MPIRKTSLFILLASMSLLGLLFTQGYWFWRTFSLQEKAFDERIHLSLRALAHHVLLQHGDTTTAIGPVRQLASNQYQIKLPQSASYAQIAGLLQSELSRRHVQLSYELALFLPQLPYPVLGGLVENVGDKTALPCLMRSTELNMYEVSLTFPYKSLQVAQCLHIWYFGLFSLVLVGITFAYGTKLLQQERQLTILKRDFINNMTHELKTPLANITLASEVLQNPASTLGGTKALHYASLIHQEAKRLEAQVTRVLEMGQLEKGQLQLQLDLVDVHELIEEITRVATLPVERKGGSLTCELLARQPLVRADKHHLRNLIHNLLENAEKYSPGSPVIALTTRNAGQQLIIAVKDQGRGMGPEKELIFEPFFRSHSGDQHDTKGFGLGLSYVRKVVEAHQARIRLTSRPNEGSQFEVFLRCV